jgi:class 3 adenylate cyclase
MGDGVLVYFGWPVAHEHSAECAVRAGLTVAAAVPGLVAEPLSARVGIATGQVVVGDLVGSDEAKERSVVGETPNLAARLQAFAVSSSRMPRAASSAICSPTETSARCGSTGSPSR